MRNTALVPVRYLSIYVSSRSSYPSSTQNTLYSFLANVAICRRPSVCRLSVTFVHPSQAIHFFRQYFYIIRMIMYPSFLKRRMVGGGDPFYVKFWVNRPPLERNRRFSTDIRP